MKKTRKFPVILALAAASLVLVLSTLAWVSGLTLSAAVFFSLITLGPAIGYLISSKKEGDKGIKGAKWLLSFAIALNLLGAGLVWAFSLLVPA